MARPVIPKKIAVCGFGLIGGCIAFDMLKGKRSYELTAYDFPAVIRRLKKDRRFPVSATGSLSKAVAGADMIILAATHDGIRTLLSQLSQIKNLADCLIIDTGAVKVPTVRMASGLSFAAGTQFMPSHPMAGRERKGFQNADAGLFREHAWYLDSEVRLSSRNKARLDWLIRKTGAVPVYISSDVHDMLVSEISHLPQLLSTILGAQVDPRWVRLAGPGMRSMLRLAGSPYSVWSEIISENRKEITDALHTFSDNIKLVSQMIKKNKSLEALFRSAARSYRCLS